MTYQPKRGDIGITKISDWGGRAIRFGQWLNGDGFADWEHAYVVTSDRSEIATETIVEAMPGGAQHVVNWHPQTLWLRCPEVSREAVAEAALDCAARKIGYSFADYGALGLHRFHIPTPHLEHFIESSGHMICSQLADYCALKGQWHIFEDGRWQGDVTPGDLFKAYKQQQHELLLGRFRNGDEVY